MRRQRSRTDPSQPVMIARLRHANDRSTARAHPERQPTFVRGGGPTPIPSGQQPDRMSSRSVRLYCGLHVVGDDYGARRGGPTPHSLEI